MTVKRNGYGQIKRTEQNRDFRRAHLRGAAKLVANGNRLPESFGTRMKNALLRYFAAV